MEVNRGETKRGIHPVSGPNPTQQNQVAETDINKMSAKYLKTRAIGNPNGRKPMFIDVPSASFHEMMNTVVRIQETFARLPARIRSKFMYNPVVLLSWLEQPDNRREAVKLGLIDDPELAYRMEQEKAAKAAPAPVQETLIHKADPESQPAYKGAQAPKTP